VLVVLRAALPWALAVIAPGCAIAIAIVPGLARRPIELLALAAPVGIGATFAVGEVLAPVDVPFTPWVTVALVATGAAVGGARLWTARARGEKGREPEPRDARVSRALAVLLLLAGMTIGLTIWVVGIRTSAAVPPNRDSVHHGFYVARIADTETVDIHEVMVSDPITAEPYGYYPLGFHASAALGHRITGTPIPDLLTGWTVLIAAVSFPLGMFVLARRLAPDRLLLPGFVALASTLFGMFPYKWILWGGLTQITSVALVPVAIAILLEATADARVWASVLAGLTAFGVASINLSQGLLVAIVVAVLLMGRWLTMRHLRAVGRQVALLAVAAATAFVLMLPTLSDALTGIADRQSIYEPNDLHIGEAIRELFTGSVFAPKAVLLYVIALVGFVIAMYRRTFIAWTMAGLVVVFIFLCAASPEFESLRELSSPWYHSPDRTSGNTVLFVAMFAGVGLEAVATALVRWIHVSPRRRPALIACSVALVAGVFAAVMKPTGNHSASEVRRAYVEDVTTQRGDLDAMAQLRRLDTTGAAVLNQEQDGSAWMYATQGLRPLFGQQPPVNVNSQSTADRVWLAQHIQEYGVDERVTELLDRYGIGYVFVNETGTLGGPVWIDLDAVRRNPRLLEVIHDGNSHVFQIVR